MSNPIETTGGAPARPRTVQLARTLTFAIAALLIVGGIAFVQEALSLKATVVGSNSEFTDADLQRGVRLLAGVVGAGVALLVIGNLGAGILLGRGRNSGRVIAWVTDGLVLLCCGCSLATSIARPGTQSTNTNSATAVQISTENVSPLSQILALTGGGLALLAAIAVVILLALPESNAYFRKPETVWNPSAYSGGDPGSGVLPPQSGWGAPPAAPPSLPPAPPTTPAAPPPPIELPPPPPTDPTQPPNDQRPNDQK